MFAVGDPHFLGVSLKCDLTREGDRSEGPLIARVRIYLYVCCGDIVLLLEIFVGAHLSFDRLGLKFTFGIGPIYMM